MNYKSSCRIYRIGPYIGAALLMAFALPVRRPWLYAAGTAVLFGGLIQAGIFYRCPPLLKGTEPEG